MKHLAAPSSLLPKVEGLILPAVWDAGEEIKATEKAPHSILQLAANACLFCTHEISWDLYKES